MEQEKNERKTHIFLIGFMGTGKSMISSQLAIWLGQGVTDTDETIKRQEGKSIPQIFEQRGEEYFRCCETRLLETLKLQKPQVISCGGGMALRAENVKLMKQQGYVVLLSASPETVWKRVKNEKNRPLLNGNMNVEFIAGLMEQRREKYEEAADISVVTDEKNGDQICQEIMKALKEME